jgi:mannose/fructose/N-acetylgalactosamine-specific phosphotransferase system component IID
MTTNVRASDLRRMALRTLLLQATFNYERQQGLGWAWALQPALERLYPDAAERRERLAEHTAYFNTQPTLASLALGTVAGLEEKRAQGLGPDAEGMARVKAVLGSSLAALGDRMFWLTLRPFAACLGVLVALGGTWKGALALWLCYNTVHLSVRFFGVGWGYRDGPAVLGEPVRRRFEAFTRATCVLGAGLVGVVTAVLLAPGGTPRPLVFQAVLAAGLGAGLVTAQRPRPSPTEWALGAGVICVAATWFR